MQKYTSNNIVLSQDSSCDKFKPKPDNFKELLESLLWLQKNRLTPPQSQDATQKIELPTGSQTQQGSLPSLKELCKCSTLTNPFRVDVKSSLPANSRIQVPLPLRTQTTPVRPFFGLTKAQCAAKTQPCAATQMPSFSTAPRHEFQA